MTTRPVQTVTLHVPVPSRRTVNWLLVIIALGSCGLCTVVIDQARLTLALLLTLAPVALAGFLATAALLTLNRTAAREYVSPRADMETF